MVSIALTAHAGSPGFLCRYPLLRPASHLNTGPFPGRGSNPSDPAAPPYLGDKQDPPQVMHKHALPFPLHLRIQRIDDIICHWLLKAQKGEVTLCQSPRWESRICDFLWEVPVSTESLCVSSCPERERIRDYVSEASPRLNMVLTNRTSQYVHETDIFICE